MSGTSKYIALIQTRPSMCFEIMFNWVRLCWCTMLAAEYRAALKKLLNCSDHQIIFSAALWVHILLRDRRGQIRCLRKGPRDSGGEMVIESQFKLEVGFSKGKTTFILHWIGANRSMKSAVGIKIDWLIDWLVDLLAVGHMTASFVATCRLLNQHWCQIAKEIRHADHTRSQEHWICLRLLLFTKAWSKMKDEKHSTSRGISSPI